MNIKQRTLEKSVKAANDFIAHLDKTGGIMSVDDMKKISSHNNIPVTFFYDCVRFGIFNSTNIKGSKSKRFKANIVKAEPKVVRQVLESSNKRRYAQRKHTPKKKTPAQATEQVTTNKIPVHLTATTNLTELKPLTIKKQKREKRQFSLFWGMLKFEY